MEKRAHRARTSVNSRPSLMDVLAAGGIPVLSRRLARIYLEAQLQDPEFAERLVSAGDAGDVSLQITQLREAAGLSQAELAKQLQTSQQKISQLEFPAYEGHLLSMLRRVAAVLHARVRVVLEPLPDVSSREPIVAEQAKSDIIHALLNTGEFLFVK